MSSHRNTASFGKRMEYGAVAELLKRNYDVYMTLVDDQQIDCIVRFENDNEPSYIDVQIKARALGSKSPSHFSAMTINKPRKNLFYIFYSEPANMYWVFPSLDIVKPGFASVNKEGKHKGKYTLVLTNPKGTTPRPIFREYENAFEKLNYAKATRIKKKAA